MRKLKIQAVVVTYNRKQLLLECMDAILKQTYEVDNIILIDNNSTDGTYEALENAGYIDNNKVIYIKLQQNIGGAGGFHEGMKTARKYNADWVWIMDDDTIPKENSLEELIKSLDLIEDNNISYLASSVYGEHGEFMNVPKISTTPSESGYPDWYKYLEKGIVKISEATFVSLLINGKALKAIGLPVKEYFIWGDDTEYTLRLNKYFGCSYMIGSSIVIHKRKGGKALSIVEENDRNRIKMYFYMIRNNYINTKEYKRKRELLNYNLSYILTSLKILFSKKSKHKFYKIHIILKGLYAAKLKKYDYNTFKNRLNS